MMEIDSCNSERATSDISYCQKVSGGMGVCKSDEDAFYAAMSMNDTDICLKEDSDQKYSAKNLTPFTEEQNQHTIVGLDEIDSYTGDFPAPLQVMWYTPENDEIFKMHHSDSEIRSWVKDAADYHGVPQELLSVILQAENGPHFTETHKVLQFGERSLTTFAAIVDKHLWDVVPDIISGGSSGLANMKRATLEDACNYTEETYNKNPLPDDVRYRLLGWDQDTRIPGDDWKADVYYCAAHVRQLIDNVTDGDYNGQLTLDQAKQVAADYNGNGPVAEKYGQYAAQTLKDAADGKTHLYFYEK